MAPQWNAALIPPPSAFAMTNHRRRRYARMTDHEGPSATELAKRMQKQLDLVGRDQKANPRAGFPKVGLDAGLVGALIKAKNLPQSIPPGLMSSKYALPPAAFTVPSSNTF